MNSMSLDDNAGSAGVPSAAMASRPASSVGPIRVGFLMDQIAGHITNYRNLRAVTDADGDIEATWTEVEYYVEGGAIERARRTWLRFVPTYFTGNARGSVELRKGLRQDYDVMFSNASVAMLFPRSFA